MGLQGGLVLELTERGKQRGRRSVLFLFVQPGVRHGHGEANKIIARFTTEKVTRFLFGLKLGMSRASPSSSPPSAALWGGWYANILDMSTFDTPAEQETFLRDNALVQVLASIEKAATLREMWLLIPTIPERVVMQLNSPLLDHLRKVYTECALCDADPYHVALYRAAVLGYKDVCEFLLDGGADIHSDEDSALCYAATKGHKDVCALLFDRGAHVHAIDNSPLRHAAMNGHKDVCALLLDSGADIHALSDCALRWAAREGHTGVVELLLDRGADIHAQNDAALKLAKAEGHKDVCALLIARGAKSV